MPSPVNPQLEAIIDELKILIDEIETHPKTSAWALRMAIKAIIEKAEKMKNETGREQQKGDL